MSVPRGRVMVVLTVIALSSAIAVAPIAASQEADPAPATVLGNADRQVEAAALRYAFATGEVGPGEPPDVVPGSLIVTTSGPEGLARFLAAGAADSRFAAAGFASADAIGRQTAIVRTTAGREGEVVAALAGLPDVIAVEPDVIREWSAVPNDPGYGLQWAHQRANIEPAWDVSTGANGPLVAVLDSGVDSAHAELQGIVVSSLQSANGQVFAGQARNDECNVGHGTMVAGVVGARGNNGTGIAGVLWAPRIIDVALTSIANGCPGGPPDSATIAAIEHMATLPEPPLVINMSLGGDRTSCPAAYATAIANARARGIVVVAAAGNNGNTATGVPGSCDGVVSAGATNSSDGRASYSQVNDFVDIAAPGGDLNNPPYVSEAQVLADTIVATCQPSTIGLVGECDPNFPPYDGITGTSFASPYVAGVIALVRSVVPSLTVDQAQAVVENTARDLGAPGRDAEFGAGIVNVAAAVAAAQQGVGLTLQPRPNFPTEGGGPVPGPVPGPPSGIVRVAAGGPTDPITQAVAVSSGLAAGSASHVVLARVDNFADALAGSAVGYGLGPLLYANPTGPLPDATRAEIQRVLPTGGAVILMGGTAALPAGLDGELQGMGYVVLRLAGGSRYETAALAAELVQEIKTRVNLASRDYTFVTFAGNWPDAVGAGQMAAYYGVPILLTDTNQLNEVTSQALQDMRPSRVFLVGGSAVLGDAVGQQIAALGLPVERLAGPSRVETSLAVSALFLDELFADGVSEGIGTVAVNLRRDFTHVLSATLISTFGNLFVPLEGDDGSAVTAAVQTFYCGVGVFGGTHLIAGGTDLITDAAAAQLVQLYQRDIQTC